jgi:hypothetical protein
MLKIKLVLSGFLKVTDLVGYRTNLLKFASQNYRAHDTATIYTDIYHILPLKFKTNYYFANSH